MNLHPLVVHFPIALLTFYALFEVLPLEQWYSRVNWRDIKALLVSFGGLGILAALATGQMAEHSLLARAAGRVLYFHKLFAGASAAVFGIIAAGYVIDWMLAKHPDLLRSAGIKLSFLRKITAVILDRRVVVALAAIGFIVLLLTGVFGEMIVYGPNNDPVSMFVYAIFFPGGRAL